MTKMSPFAFILIFFFIQNGMCACQTKTEIESIFQDQITLKLDKNRYKHDYSYPPVLFGGSSPRVALTIDSLDIKDAPNIEYQIASILDPSGSLIFNFISTTITARWRQLRLSFWLVNQNFSDISIGHILFENIAPLGSKSLLFSEADELLLSKVSPSTNSKIFLSTILGLSADISNKSLSFSSVAELQFYQQSENITKCNISFRITVGEQTKINLIRYSYILYSPSKLSNLKHISASLTLQLTKQTLNDRTTYYNSIESVLIFPVKYSLIGLTGFKIKNFESINLDLSIESGLSNLLKVQSGTQIDVLETDYLIVGVDMTMSCINCSNEYVKTEGSIAVCVALNQCNADEIPFATAINSMMNVFSCRKCVGNREISVIGETGQKSCVCKTGYQQELDGICREIETFKSISECAGDNSVRESATGKCVCKDGFYFDDFNQCSNVCDPLVSSLNITTSKCVCFIGYIMNEYTKKCVKSDSNCVENQIKKGNTCECDGFTIKTQETPLICKECSSGTFKVQDKNECQICDTSCRECISNEFCLACSRGFYFKDFKCETKCGDAIKKGTEKCDDGNDVNGDGCSNTCEIEDAFICLEDANGKSSCYKKGEEPSVNPSAPSEPEPTEHTPVDINAEDYKLSLAQSSPIFQSSGITLELLVKPAIKREQEELRKMIKVEISDSRAIPAMVYIAQDPNNFASIRCYLHYNNILPIVDFSMKVYAVLGEGIWRTVTASTKNGAKLMNGRAVRSMY